MNLAHVGVQLKAARVARGMSAVRASKVSGVSRRRIAQAETGANVTIDTLVALMEAYGITQISLTDAAALSTATDANAAALRIVVDELQGDIHRLQAVLDALRAVVEGEERSDIAKAAALVRDATRAAKKSGRQAATQQGA